MKCVVERDIFDMLHKGAIIRGVNYSEKSRTLLWKKIPKNPKKSSKIPTKSIKIHKNPKSQTSPLSLFAILFLLENFGLVGQKIINKLINYSDIPVPVIPFG
jgi:hypothetical protein